MSHRSKYQQLPTEAINPATLGIDKASSADIIELMLNDDRKVLAAVQREKPRIAIGVDLIVEMLRRHGRVIFVGAGTSGRLGVVESAEMPTTFGTNPDSIQAVMAGGKDAFLHTKEGAEDSYEDGARAITRLKPTKKDVVIGVSASGMTPYVRGGLTRARKAGFEVDFRDLRSADRAPDVRGPDDRAGRRAGGHRGFDAPQGGHGDQARAQHADDRGDGAHRQDLRQLDGRSRIRHRRRRASARAGSSRW